MVAHNGWRGAEVVRAPSARPSRTVADRKGPFHAPSRRTAPRTLQRVQHQPARDACRLVCLLVRGRGHAALRPDPAFAVGGAARPHRRESESGSIPSAATRAFR